MIHKILDKIKEYENISIICHKFPDADAIGSMVALKEILDIKTGKEIRMICLDEMSGSLSKIFGEDLDVKSNLEDSDCLVFVDCSSLDVSGLSREDIRGIFTISIDHHFSHNCFADLNIVDRNSSSTCEMIYGFYKEFGVTISRQVLKAIAAGILYDTGGLMHSNTSARTLRIISKIKQAGINLQDINSSLFKKSSSRDLRMFGLIFKKAKINQNGVLSCVINKAEIKDIDCCEFEMKKAIDFLNHVQGKKIALLGVKDLEGGVKISMRSQDSSFDVAKIAHLFDGGGHVKAAGFKVKI